MARLLDRDQRNYTSLPKLLQVFYPVIARCVLNLRAPPTHTNTHTHTPPMFEAFLLKRISNTWEGRRRAAAARHVPTNGPRARCSTRLPPARCTGASTARPAGMPRRRPPRRRAAGRTAPRPAAARRGRTSRGRQAHTTCVRTGRPTVGCRLCFALCAMFLCVCVCWCVCVSRRFVLHIYTGASHRRPSLQDMLNLQQVPPSRFAPFHCLPAPLCLGFSTAPITRDLSHLAGAVQMNAALPARVRERSLSTADWVPPPRLTAAIPMENPYYSCKL